LAERPSAAWDARALQVEAAEAVAVCASAPRRAAVLWARLGAVAGAGEHAAAAVAAAQHGAAAVAEEAPASLRAGVAEEVEARVLPRAAAGEAEEPVLLPAAVARPSAAPWAFHPGRVLPWPAPPRAARFAHTKQCSQIAPLTARWWPAARGEVWSWRSRSPE
jgi:hypothetical protein